MLDFKNGKNAEADVLQCNVVISNGMMLKFFKCFCFRNITRLVQEHFDTTSYIIPLLLAASLHNKLALCN